jgi:hypothetical protein
MNSFINPNSFLFVNRASFWSGLRSGIFMAQAQAMPGVIEIWLY